MESRNVAMKNTIGLILNVLAVILFVITPVLNLKYIITNTYLNVIIYLGVFLMIGLGAYLTRSANHCINIIKPK